MWGVGVRPGEEGRGGDPNRTGIMYLYENPSRFGNQRGTLAISSGFVAGVSRRMAAGVPGPG